MIQKVTVQYHVQVSCVVLFPFTCPHVYQGMTKTLNERYKHVGPTAVSFLSRVEMENHFDSRLWDHARTRHMCLCFPASRSSAVFVRKIRRRQVGQCQ